MARAKAPRKTTTDERTPEHRLVDAALALAARQGWRRTGLAEIAAEAGLKLHEAYAIHRSKGAILRAFTRRIDVEVLAGAGETDAEESRRERLFDTMMRRYEAMKPYREGLRAILRDSVGPGAIGEARTLRRSMAWMLEASGIPASGCRGRVLAGLTLALHLQVLRVFLGDDSAELAQTMAALDRGLRRGASLYHRIGRRPGRGRPDGAPSPA